MSSDPEILLTTRKFTVVRRTINAPGKPQRVHDSVQHPGAVVILPMVDEDHVCLIRNHRPSVGRTLIELPAGTLEPGEDPAKTAERELIEETGYRAAKIEQRLEFFMSPGILNERMFLFLALGLSPGPTAREPGEEIENLVVPWDEALAMAMAGQIEDAKTLVGLFHYDRLRRAPVK